MVNEEVRVAKRAVQRTENVSDNVRHEELRVDKDGGHGRVGDGVFVLSKTDLKLHTPAVLSEETVSKTSD